MILDYNSFSATMYRWFYGTFKMPSSLCKYFWKLCIAWIFVVPALIITLPYLISCKFKATIGDYYNLMSGFFYWILIYLTLSFLSLFSLIWSIPKEDSFLFVMVITGMIIFVVIIVLLVGYFISNGVPKFYKKNIKQTSLIKEFIKAKVNRYCPSIEWKR